MNLTRLSSVLGLMVVLFLSTPRAVFAQASSLRDDFFATEVRPIFEQHCVKCHSGPSPKAGLRLTDRESLLQGGDTGSAVSLDRVEDSLLLSAIKYDAYEMPPTGKLPQEAIDNIKAWLDAGAPWPVEQNIASPHGAETTHNEEPQVTAETKQFWSFQPVQRPDVPEVAGDWPRTPIDRFIRARLQRAGLVPNPPADRQTLVRRAYYDLTGLPPSFDDVRQFMEDDAPDAFSRLVDKLLASPHYGEKWGRHWLDLVRFAETNSYERDATKPNAWRYRDFVIESFNNDKPYDQFIIEQLAGDELPEREDEQIIATGFYRLGAWDDEPVDAKQALYDDLDDILTTTCQVFLGLTINCARCHDHKLDPIPQEDYYRMIAFFGGVTRYGGPNRGRDLKYSQVPLAPRDVIEANARDLAAYHEDLRALNELIRATQELLQSQLPGGQRDDFDHDQYRVGLVEQNVPELFTRTELDNYVRLRRDRERLHKAAPQKLPTALAVTEVGSSARDVHVLIRGNAQAVGKSVTPGFPEVLDQPPPHIEVPNHGASSGRRLALAKWIASPSNPLTARVMANRIWQYHFGEGLVRTPNNFGLKGSPPTHPQLLDWLATEFIDNDWQLKHLHRLIMNSAVYQMSSVDNEAGLATDPENRLLWRFNMRRLTAEEIRDSILAVNGTLNLEMGGPSIYPEIPPEVLAGQSRPGEGWGKSSPEEAARRSVYIFVKRSLIPPMISSFDGADTDFTCPVRFATTQPTQSLSMMNGPYLRQQARALQTYLVQRAPDDTRRQIELALQQVQQRIPTPKEVERGWTLVRSLIEEEGMTDKMAMHSFCVVALNLNEFIYLD